MSVQIPDPKKVAPSFECPHCRITSYNISKCEQCNYIFPTYNVEIGSDLKYSKPTVQLAAPTQDFTGLGNNSQLLVPPKSVKLGVACPHCKTISYDPSKCGLCNLTLPGSLPKLVVCDFRHAEPSKQSTAPTQNTKFRTSAVKMAGQNPSVQSAAVTQNFTGIKLNSSVLITSKSVNVGVLCPSCGILSYNISNCDQCSRTLPGNVEIICDSKNSNNSKPPTQSTNPILPTKIARVAAVCPHCGFLSFGLSKCERCKNTLQNSLKPVPGFKSPKRLVKPTVPILPKLTLLKVSQSTVLTQKFTDPSHQFTDVKLQRLSTVPMLKFADVKLQSHSTVPTYNFTDVKLQSLPVAQPEEDKPKCCPHCDLSLNFSKCQHCIQGDKNLMPAQTIPAQKITEVKLNGQLQPPTMTQKVKAILESFEITRKEFSTSTDTDHENKREKPRIETHPTLNTDCVAVEERACCQSSVDIQQTLTKPDNEVEQIEKSRTAMHPAINGVAAEFTDPAFVEEPLSFAGKYSASVEDGELQEEPVAPAAPYHYLLMLCKALHIGTYKVVTSEKVVLSTKGLVMRVPLPSDQSVIVSIAISDICRFMVSYSRTMPVLFINLSTNGGSKVRKALHMNDLNDESFYFDPSSTDDTLRHIILLPENITEDFKMKLTRIVDISRRTLVQICVGPELKLFKNPACAVPEIVTLSSDEEE
ncbi:uncharacterized protein LOC117651680 isoform X2 [Thrips palmi]|uniref:Uncharacterized protein LOC117651680 isoform X2 n=1 Tax=Thrips palmi TaxID=161013 RepID=A0A6P9A333_THRPL|nr:uncharacterized protein LOC117651680 isoform X2 [Thrips palmi]